MPTDWVLDSLAPHSLAGARPAVRSNTTKELPGARSPPAQRFNDLLYVGPSETAGILETKTFGARDRSLFSHCSDKS